MKYSLKVVGKDGTIEVFNSDSRLEGTIFYNDVMQIRQYRSGNVYEIIAEFKDAKYWRVEEVIK
jgi:hypothetical protein